MEPSVLRKFVLLGRELRNLIEENNDRFICDAEGRIYGYIWEHVNSWMAANYSQHADYSRNEINALIGKILEYIADERLLLRDRDYCEPVYDESRTYNSDEINTIESLDGAQDYGKSYRDNGAFGSYPLHDDHSEEGDM